MEGTKYASAKKIFVRFWSFSGSNFPAFGLNREIYSVSLRIQSECRKIRTRKTPNTDTSHTVSLRLSNKFFLQTKQVTEEFTWRCSIKKVSACNFFKKRLQYRCFFCDFCKNYQNKLFNGTLPVVASELKLVASDRQVISEFKNCLKIAMLENFQNQNNTSNEKLKRCAIVLTLVF